MKKHFKYLFGLIVMSFFTMSSCDKDNEESIPKFLDVNVNFTIKPDPGKALIVNLYYTDSEEEKFFERTPDAVINIALSEEEIENGLRVTFDDFKESPYAYVSAYVDVDGSNSITDGDIAVFYANKSIKDIMDGYVLADNVADEYAITVDMRREVGVEPLRDIDGNEYETMILGNQEWMVENLKVTRYNNGDPIETKLSDEAWAATDQGAYAIYPYANVNGISSEAQMKDHYGLLYNGYAALDSRNIAPEGWRVPTDDDWKELEIYVGMTEQEANGAGWRGTISRVFRSTTGWPDRFNGTDDFGFAVLPGGSRNANGSYDYINARANFWTTTPSGTQNDRYLRRIFQDTYETINRSNWFVNEGYSVRCVRDIN